MTDVFLSYARDDAPRARAIGRALEGVGANVWTTDSEIAVGENSAESIEKRLTDANVIALLITRSFLTSDWANYEMGYALARSRDAAVTVVPIRLDDAELPKFLNQFNVIDARSLTAQELAEKMPSMGPKAA